MISFYFTVKTGQESGGCYENRCADRLSVLWGVGGCMCMCK